MGIKRDEFVRVATAIYAAQCVNRLNDLPDNKYAIAAAERLIAAVEWRIHERDSTEYEPCQSS